MARPTKQGVDYFPLDCQFDDKTEMYIIESGAKGLAVLITLWQMIYSNEGYYIVNNTDLHLLIKRKIDVGINEVSDCINICLRRNLFNNSIHEKYGILTSKAIQKRYFDAAKKKKEVNIFTEYLLIPVDSYENLVYSSLNPVNSCGNATKEKEEEEVKVNRKKTSKKRSTSIPDDFDISDEVRAWAEKNNHKNLEEHLENFKLAAAKKDYHYADWDSAFKSAIRNNWAKVTEPQSKSLSSYMDNLL